MSFLDHIRACNNADLSEYVPWYVGEVRAGWLRPAFARTLLDRSEIFRRDGGGLSLTPRLADPDARTAALAPVLRDLADEGVIAGWRDEPYAVAPEWGAPALLRVERAACPRLGVRAWGVHLNGYVRRADGLHLWVGFRSRTKPTYPGELDNTVAGGQPHGLGLQENLIKEAAEEAGLAPDLVAGAVCVGLVSYVHATAEGVKPDQMFCYDLELPEHVTPANRDGEIERFELWPVEEVARTVCDSFDFKFNCNLVLIDFLIRHGVITPESERDFAALCLGLRRGA